MNRLQATHSSKKLTHYHSNDVRNQFSIESVCNRLGIKVNRDGRCQCPLHNGKDRNFSINRKKNLWRCFVCGKGGDVIALVKEIRHCNFYEACEWLGAKPVDDAEAERLRVKSARDKLLAETYRTEYSELCEIRRWAYSFTRIVRIHIDVPTIDRLWNNKYFCWALDRLNVIDWLLEMNMKEYYKHRKEAQRIYGEYRELTGRGRV